MKNYPGDELVRPTRDWWAAARKSRRYIAKVEPHPSRPWLTEAWLREHHGPHWIDVRADEFLFELQILGERALTKVHPLAGLERRRARLNPGLRQIDVLT